MEDELFTMYPLTKARPPQIKSEMRFAAEIPVVVMSDGEPETQVQPDRAFPVSGRLADDPVSAACRCSLHEPIEEAGADTKEVGS